MAITPRELAPEEKNHRVDYPTRDGRPMGETDLHRNDMFDLIETLKLFYEGERVYVSGNILLFYERGNRRRHVSPDVLVVKGLEHRERDNFLLWEEGKPPNMVIEVTSASTREEDLKKKFEVYRDLVKVAEYFLFDPRGEYLSPALKGYRLSAGEYVPIGPVNGRFPSEELGIELEQSGKELRLYHPAKGAWLPTPREVSEKALADQQRAESRAETAEAGRRQAEAEAARLRNELEKLRRQSGSA